MKIRAKVLTFVFVLVSLSINPPRTEAVWLHLTDQQRQEAIRFGEQSSWKQLLLEGEWVRESGGTKAVMQTPFLILAAMAKRLRYSTRSSQRKKWMHS